VVFLVGLAMLVACSKHAEAPRSALRQAQGPQTHELSQIDTLMWHHPDSALAVMMEFAGSEAADSMDVFEGHYCQVLIAELLFKNDYGQSNREEVLKAVRYFDSIVGMDGFGADTRGVSVRERDAFLAARAHYMNGVGYYEQGDLVNACAEYLSTLRIMESHFGENELVGHKPRFMALTYNRLLDLFKGQLMPEPAIYCAKQSLVYNQIAPTSLNAKANILSEIGLEYHILEETDSVVFYYEAAFNALHDRNNLVYRDLMASQALFDYYEVHDTIKALACLKSMAAQAESETERITRYSTIGDIYHNAGQFDSAKVYLETVFDFAKDATGQKLAAKALHDIAISEGDTLIANQYAQFLIEDVSAAAESQKRVSQLNELFQQHLQWEQERAETERQQATRLRRNRMIVVVCVLVVVAALLAWLLHRRKMKQQRDEASQQMEAVQEAHRLEKASMSGRLKKSNQELRELKDQMRQQAGNGAPKQEAQAVSFNEEPICRLIMERVNEGQFKAQMDCKLYQDYALGKEQVMALREAADRHFGQFTSRLAKAYPNLTKGDLDYCCLYLLGLSDADVAAMMQKAYPTVSHRARKMKAIFKNEAPLPTTLLDFAKETNG
jgi:predicted negative regulator of RcsB-dependent stress response